MSGVLLMACLDGQRNSASRRAGTFCCSSGFQDFALARYKLKPDGTLDTTFGSGGKVITDFSGSDSDDYAYALAIQSDAKILAGGFSNANGFYDFALARYNPDGALDTSFGSSGKVLTDFVNEQDVIYSFAAFLSPEVVGEERLADARGADCPRPDTSRAPRR